MSDRESQVEAVEASLGVRLPTDYRTWLIETGGFTGWRGDDAYIQLDAPNTLVATNTSIPHVDTHPGCLFIGTDGSRELIGLDLRLDPARVVLVSIASRGWHDAIEQAPNWATFWSQLPEAGFRFE